MHSFDQRLQLGTSIMLLCPAGKVAVFELILSTPPSPTMANVVIKAMCPNLATDWPEQHNISGSPKAKEHTQHPGIALAADPLGSTQTLTGKLRSDRFKRPPSAGPDDSWCTSTRTGVG